MTKGKLWWLVKEEDGVYIYCSDPTNKGFEQSGSPLRQFGSGPHRRVSHEVGHITSVSVVTSSSLQVPRNRKLVEAVMFKFSGQDDKPQVLSRHQFEWNKTPFSRLFKRLTSAASFVTKFKELLHQQDELSPNEEEPMDLESLDSQNSSEPITSSQDILSSQPVRKRPKKTGITDYENTVKKHLIGHFKIDIERLEFGEQIRPIDDSFVNYLITELKEFADECYQPICAFVKDTPIDQFDEQKVNEYNYLVLGGQHLLKASKELKAIQPSEFDARWCVVYGELSHEQIMWLSHRHNITHSHHKPMGLKDKVAFCRNFKGDNWKKTCAAIFNEKSKLDTSIIIQLAALPDDLFTILNRVLQKGEHGDLKGQKLDYGERMYGQASIKPIIFRHFILQQQNTQLDILQQLERGERDLKSFKKETQVLHKLQLIQTAFLREVNLKTWEEAVTSYPHQTTRERLSAFLSCNFQHGNRPASLVAFAKAAVLEHLTPASSVSTRRDVTGAFIGLNGSSIGHVLNMDVLKVDDNIISKNTTDFTGFDLAILDFPENWTVTELQKLCVMLRFVNMQLTTPLSKYNLVCMCSVQQQQEIVQALQAETFCKVEVAFYKNVSSTSASAISKGLTLSQDVGALVCAYWSASGRVQHDQLPKPRSNFFLVDQATSFQKDANGKVLNPKQKPLELLQDLVSAMCPSDGWVLDACCGTGTGITACLLQGLNCVAVEQDKEQCSCVEKRLTSVLFPADRQNAEEDDDTQEEDFESSEL